MSGAFYYAINTYKTKENIRKEDKNDEKDRFNRL